MQKNKGDYQLWPFVRMPNGTYSVPDRLLYPIYMSLVNDGKLDKVFYDEPTLSFDSFIEYLKNPANHVVFVIDKKQNNFVLIAWLNGLRRTFAYSHFTSIGEKNYKTVIGKLVLDYWTGLQPKMKIIGITPETYTAANKVARKIGYKPIGTIPGICYMAKDKKLIGGVIAYFEKGGQ